MKVVVFQLSQRPRTPTKRWFQVGQSPMGRHSWQPSRYATAFPSGPATVMWQGKLL